MVHYELSSRPVATQLILGDPLSPDDSQEV